MDHSIRIEDEHGGFVIVIDEQRFLFDDEDSHEGLIKVFEFLGYKNVTYEEVC